MAHQNLGSWIRAQRDARGWTQKEMSIAAGVDSGTISRWERGVSRPELAQLQRLCGALSVELSEALDLYGDGDSEDEEGHGAPSVHVADAGARR